MKQREIPVHHMLEKYLDQYLAVANPPDDPKQPLFTSTPELPSSTIAPINASSLPTWNESGTLRNSRTAMPEPETETLPKFLFSIPVKAYWIDPGATFIFCLGWVPLAL